MTRDELEHAIRAACDVAGDTELIIVGSQSILGQFPNAPDALRQSMEVDVIPMTWPERSDKITGVLGELSMFHETHGFYVDGVDSTTAVLPPGWKGRLVAVHGAMTYGNTGWCLEPHDLAASKLAAFRDKDRDYVRVLIETRMIAPETLIDRLHELPIADVEQARRVKWVDLTVDDLHA